ncbi:NAD(P)-binding domain-containing protein [Glycomyces sp. L485]|uniref:NADPH-dependent F420 reductase n=1 Tax=Glycomyces sp. L485 TaxID=2909235 RepID=UPI001F4B069E|nr:NAD(P)-binding domain-containing protein [Glycomyces sp. L485]MCH7232937.1 NAD(P)-binding domain-containing protein [Glycomyces sp. L485]
MKIAVMGTGVVGRTLAGRLAELGHEVTVGTRDTAATLAREPEQAESFAVWAESRPGIALASFADAAGGAELIVNATSGRVSLEALGAAGEADLAGKVVLDVANPLDFTGGFPPTLRVKDDDSLAERIQRAFPAARVVKSLNTMTAPLMADPRRLADGDHSVFVSGDDAGAKRTVTELLEQMGHADVIDLGDITTSRGAEMVLPLWLRLYGRLGTAEFNFKIVR